MLTSNINFVKFIETFMHGLLCMESSFILYAVTYGVVALYRSENLTIGIPKKRTLRCWKYDVTGR